MSDTILVCAVWLDFEKELPDAYVCDEEQAKKLLEGHEDTGNYIKIYVSLAEWGGLFYDR